MSRNQKTTIFLAGLVLVALIMCGLIGYINNSNRVFSTTAKTDETLPTDTPAAIDLVYCSTPASLCIISFGQDNSGNMLIVIRNSISGLVEFYAKLNPTEASDFYPCQKVQFASNLYYCVGGQIPDGTMVTMDVYSKDDNRLVASGKLPVSFEATPTLIPTKLPTSTASSPATKAPTSTTSSFATKVPTSTTSPSATPRPLPYPYYP